MIDALRGHGNHGGPLPSTVVVACPAHEPAVFRAIAAGDDVDDATLRAVDEAKECPACQLLLALASGDAAFLGRGPAEFRKEGSEKVIPFPVLRPQFAATLEHVSSPARRIAVMGRLAAATNTLCVGPSIAGRFNFLLGPSGADDAARTTVEVRLGRRGSIGVRWLSGPRVRLRDGGTLIELSSINLPAQDGRRVWQVLEEKLELAD